MRVGAAVVVLLATVGTAGAANQESDDSPSGVSITPVLYAAIDALEPKARDTWPDTFAGLWIEETEDSVLRSITVAFTEEAGENRDQLRESFPAPELFQPALTFEHSLQELEARQNEMITDREQAREGDLSLPGVPGGQYDLDIDVKRNAIIAIVEDASPEATATFKARYGDDVIVEDGVLATPDCTRSDCRYGLRSGLNTSGCTTAFTVTASATGDRNILSAAHCGGADVGANRLHGGEIYGNVEAQQQSGRVDAERHALGLLSQFEMWPRIFVNNNNKFVGVNSMSTWAGLSTGQQVCQSGITSGKSCGEVVGKNYSPSYVPNSNRFIRANYCRAGGDSGAGVYRSSDWGRVHGIHSGGIGSCQGIFGHIQYALNALNATLVTI